MAVMPLRNFPVHPLRAPPERGGEDFRDSRRIIALSSLVQRKPSMTRAGSRPANGARVPPGAIASVSPGRSLEAIYRVTVGILAGSVALMDSGHSI